MKQKHGAFTSRTETPPQANISTKSTIPEGKSDWRDMVIACGFADKTVSRGTSILGICKTTDL